MRLFVSRAAQVDLLEIWTHVAEDSVAAADRLLEEIGQAIDRALEFPEMGRERKDLYDGIRSLPVRGYVLFYRTREDRLEIVRVLHGSRDVTSVHGPGESWRGG